MSDDSVVFTPIGDEDGYIWDEVTRFGSTVGVLMQSEAPTSKGKWIYVDNHHGSQTFHDTKEQAKEATRQFLLGGSL